MIPDFSSSSRPTNAHVICGNAGGFSSKIVSITRASGEIIPLPDELELSETHDPTSPRGLEDLARFPIRTEAGLEVYDISTIGGSSSMSAEVVAYGNSLGGDVMTELPGKVVGLGSDRIEIDCEIMPGNSGGPVVLKDSKLVIGISTYLTKGRRDIWSRNTVFEKVRRFAVLPSKVQKWRKMKYTSLLAALAELSAFERDTLSLAAACLLTPKANRGGFDAPSTQRGDYIVREVILAGSRNGLGSAIASGVSKVNQRLGAATATVAMAEVVPVFAEFFSTVVAQSAAQMKSLAASNRAPYLKGQFQEMLSERKTIHEEFIAHGTRFR